MTRELSQPPAGDGSRRYGHWMTEALAAEPDAVVRPLKGEQAADLVIIGGGYVGLWTAIRAAEAAPGMRVVVLEADICGSGASGRNGGFAFGWWPKIETLVERVGEAEALRLANAADDAVRELGEFCIAEGIEADFRLDGWLWTATSPAQRGAWRGAMNACATLGAEPFEELSGEEVRARTGSPVQIGGALERNAATVQPAKLCRGLAAAARRRGVEIFERSPALRIERRTGRVETPASAVRAGAIVLAGNAWMARIRELRRAIVPLSSDVVATAPIPRKLAASGWCGGESISDSRLMVHYYRTTADGRVVFGKGGGGLGRFGRFPGGFDFHAGRARRTARFLNALVPATDGIPITEAWGGAVDRSSDGLPFFGALGAGKERTGTGCGGGGGAGAPIHYGVGFSGNGVVPSLLAGRILASLALGRDDEWSRCGLVGGIPGWFPTEPARSVGGVLVREAVRRKERLEDRGRDVSWPTRRVAALAPSGFFKASGADEDD